MTLVAIKSKYIIELNSYQTQIQHTKKSKIQSKHSRQFSIKIILHTCVTHCLILTIMSINLCIDKQSHFFKLNFSPYLNTFFLGFLIK